MGVPRVRGRRVEESRVGDAAAASDYHAVVDLQDDPRGAVLAVLGLVAFADDWKGVEDVRVVVALEAEDTKVGCVQFASEQEPPNFVPAERRTVVPTVTRPIRLHV